MTHALTQSAPFASEQLHPSADHAAGLAVKTTGLTKHYDDRPVLCGIDFALPIGGFVALLGANGAGKSTLLQILAMLTAASSGELQLFGSVCGPRSGTNQVALRARIGMIGHQLMLYRDLTAMENLLFFGQLYSIRHPRERAEQLLTQVGLIDRAQDVVGTFSRGMSQRLAIARALMHEPKLLLADEPFAGLDVAATHILMQILRDLHDAGQTIVLTDHDIARSVDLADRVITLRHGRIVFNESVGRDADAILRQAVCDKVLAELMPCP